jgi:general secretion pathway protein G
MKRYLSVVIIMLVSCYTGVGAPEADSDVRGKLVKNRVQLKALSAAIQKFKADCGTYPTEEQGLEALLKDQRVKGWNGPYFPGKRIPDDPWGTPYGYARTKPKKYDIVTGWGPSGYRVESAGPDTKLGTNDDLWSK